MAMIQASREAGSRCGRKSARMIVAASASTIAAELMSCQVNTAATAAYCGAAVQFSG
jgi:hypothetical protein